MLDSRELRADDVLDAPSLIPSPPAGFGALIDNLRFPCYRGADVPPRTRTALKSKIHRATVTDADLNHVGSITVDVPPVTAFDGVPVPWEAR